MNSRPDRDPFVPSLNEFDDTVRFWLEVVCSIAKEGHSTISGYNMLEATGFKNPYSKDAQKVMKEALDSVFKATGIWLTIDTSDEARAHAAEKRTKLASCFSLRRVIEADLALMKLSNGGIDFEIRLKAGTSREPLSALPLTRYAVDKRQLLSAVREDFEFVSVDRMTIERKRMWRHITRRLSESGAITTIVFEDMFRNVEMIINSQKKETVLDVLRKMLEERKANGDEYLMLLKESRDRVLSAKEVRRLENLSSKKLIKEYRLNQDKGKDGSLTIELL